jgi:tripartite-type tricarboxylate transporter receptor subunit TctC
MEIYCDHGLHFAAMRGSPGQPIVVENVGGADRSVGTGRAAHGYTANHVLNGGFYSLPYDVLNDFVPIAALTMVPLALLREKAYRQNGLMELITWLKANPQAASAGVASAGFRLLSISFQRETRTRLTLVPYRGAAPARLNLVAGQIDLMFGIGCNGIGARRKSQGVRGGKQSAICSSCGRSHLYRDGAAGLTSPVCAR